ncbi:MAG: HAMP domain-containing histidine kinase [Sphingobacteriaceae bacterium]|nr:HAMP domain-containing histidine kinase [Sphingobacteriaceae bacterium]
MAIKKQEGILGQAADFFSNIFSTEYWPARWHCGKWTDFHGWLYIISDVMIWAAYFAIPFLLFRMITKRTDLPFPKIFWLFIAFILLCGLTHLIDAVIFWWPAYRLSAVIRFVAGVVSLFTVYALYKILPVVFTFRTAKQLEAEIEQRKKAEEEARILVIENDKAKELLRVKDEFINLASHELKTPLTSIRGYLQIIQMKSLKSDPQNRDLITKATNQTAKLTNLINDLFNVSKMQMGLQPLEKSEINLNELINELAADFETLNRHVSVEADEEVIIVVDRDRIKKVLENLLENAFKYSKADSEVILRVRKVNDRIKVSIQDYGLGIGDDKIQHVFERYYRVEHTSQNYSGMGLGLYICAQIINQHGGVIGVESQLGKGSIFWFELPYQPTQNLSIETYSSDES